MPELYAQAFDLTALNGADASLAMSSAIEEWVQPRWPRDNAWFNFADSAGLKAPDGSIFRWEPFTDGSRAFLDFTWRHGHAENPAISWSTRVSFARLPGRTYVSIRVANTGPALGEPGCLLTTRPRLLLQLCERFVVKSNGSTHSVRPTRLDDDAFPSFVRYELFDPDRDYPIVLLSPAADGRYVISPESLGREFVGIAKTYVAVTPRSTFALTDEIGRRDLSCFHGALRVYLPGLTREDPAARHPLVVPRRLAVQSERLKVAQILTAVSARHFEEEAFIAELRDERALAIEDRRRRLVSTLEQSKRAATDGEDFRQLAEIYAQHNEQLQTQVDDLQDKLEDALQKVAALQYALSQRAPSDGEVGIVAPALEPSSVLDAVEQAAVLYPEDLLILERAIESAADSPFERAEQVLDTLRKVAEVAKQVRSGPLGEPLRNVLQRLGVDYRPGIAKTTPKKIRRQYQFSDSENEYTCEEHICLGGGTYDPADCLRIYLNTKDHPDRRFVIGHVGRHLDVITTT